ncbi:MAG: phosphatidate cytidylyltransferase [Clostridiales bacterium]|nr:phosphatidate cytidylyltransferase [Clostridiales bacterium]
MKERVIGGFFVFLLTLIMLLPGGMISAIVLGVISIRGMYEFCRVYKLEKSVLAYISYIATSIFYIMLYYNQTQFLFPFVLLFLMILLSVYVFTFPKFKDKDIAAVFFGFMYVTVLLSYVFRVRSLTMGIFLAFFILISSWGNDVFAYFVGSAIGKHKFSPKVSPKKSVEGFFGGIAGAALVGYLYALIISRFVSGSELNALYCAVIAALGAIPSVIGDLAASAIKRNNEIKDYGKLIPGHGGILDRFDSVIFTAPIIYYLVVLFQLI